MMISDIDVTVEIEKRLKGQSPLFAVMGSTFNQLLLGRDKQRFLVTIQEIPREVE